MDERERQRLQELVDAIHLTAAALQQAHATPTDLRISATAWMPTPVPRGWHPTFLGSIPEEAMFVPYLPVPSMVPVYPMINGPMGFSHAGMGNGGGWNPLGYGYGYGYRPTIPAGYGLTHAGWEGQMMGYGPMAQGGMHYVPMQMMNPGYSMGYGMHYPMGGMPMQMPMQPNWSPMPGNGTQQNG